MTTRPGVVASMTGFGRFEASSRTAKVACEIRTVNHRHLDLSLSVPGALTSWDPEARNVVKASLSRGRVDVTITVETGKVGGPVRPIFDEPLARWYFTKLNALARSVKAPPPRVEAIAQLPGVITPGRASEGPPDVQPLATKALAGALKRLAVMRQREGATLVKDLLGRLATVHQLSIRLEETWPAAAARQRERNDVKVKALLDRILEPGAGAGATRDLVQAVERGDITEEIVRLRSNCDQFREALAAGSPVGRKLDFVIQEIHREINTAGAKSNDAALSPIIVQLKEEVERIREQVQNLE